MGAQAAGRPDDDRRTGAQCAAFLSQTLRILEQTAYNGGSWGVSWHLSALEDPLGEKKWAGTAEEMEAYRRTKVAKDDPMAKFLGE